MKKFDTSVTVTESERKKEWIKLLGTNTLPVVSIIPSAANLPGFEKPKAVYKLDLEKLEDDEILKIQEHLSIKFKIDLKFVQSEFYKHGVPILADHCNSQTSNQSHFFSLIG